MLNFEEVKQGEEYLNICPIPFSTSTRSESFFTVSSGWKISISYWALNQHYSSWLGIMRNRFITLFLFHEIYTEGSIQACKPQRCVSFKLCPLDKVDTRNTLRSPLWVVFCTRSLGALWAPTSSWRPFGPLDFVLRALRALRPCDPRIGVWIASLPLVSVIAMDSVLAFW